MFPLLLIFKVSESHLINQFLLLGIGIVIILVISFVMFQLLWKAFSLEAIKSTRLSIITGLLLTFIWFALLFKSLISLHLIIIIAVIVIAILFLTVSKLEES